MLEGMTEASNPLDDLLAKPPGLSRFQRWMVPCELAQASRRGVTPSALKARQLMPAWVVPRRKEYAFVACRLFTNLRNRRWQCLSAVAIALLVNHSQLASIELQ